MAALCLEKCSGIFNFQIPEPNNFRFCMRGGRCAGGYADRPHRTAQVEGREGDVKLRSYLAERSYTTPRNSPVRGLA